MANFTKLAIKNTFIELLEERPLSNITVKDLVAKCGINRNSFYYHYQDLPALIEEIIEEEAELFIKKYPSVNSVIDCYDALTEFVTEKKKIVMHIFRSVNRETFEINLMSVSTYFVTEYVNTALSGMVISNEDKECIVNYYKCVCFGLVIDWLNSGMDAEHAASVRRIFLLQKEHANDIAELLSKEVLRK